MVSDVVMRMIACSGGNRHDIRHFLEVFAYARLIGLREGLDEKTQKTLEMAAAVHDIACPLCREKYGNTAGRHQEEEGPPLARALLTEAGVPEDIRERVAYLVGHHHTIHGVDGPDYQILLEADYLVNADEGNYSVENIRRARETWFRTETGKALLQAVYPE